MTTAGVLSTPIAATTGADGVAAFARGRDNAVYRFHGPAEPAPGWESLGGNVSSDLSVVSSPSGLLVIARGAKRGTGAGGVRAPVSWSPWQTAGGFTDVAAGGECRQPRA